MSKYANIFLITRKFGLAIILFFCAIIANAQTGIGTTSPNASAKLDVSSTNKAGKEY